MLHELRTAAVIHATSPERGMDNYVRFEFTEWKVVLNT